jgi:eukaryotic-like serine/threonine-protein kinase
MVRICSHIRARVPASEDAPRRPRMRARACASIDASGSRPRRGTHRLEAEVEAEVEVEDGAMEMMGPADVSSDAGDARAHLQSRLRLFHLVLFALSGAMFAVAFGMIATLHGAGYDASSVISLVNNAALVAVAGASWLVLRARRLGVGTLHAIDAVVCGIGGLLAAHWMSMMPPRYRPELGTMLVMSQVLFARAALVPSTPLRTVGCGAAVMLPVAIATHFLFTEGATPPWLEPSGAIVVLTVALSAIVIALSALTSRVIYGLRRRVEQAMQAMQLGQYTVERLIGRGGMGSVYLARHSLLRRPTALKVLEAAAAGDEAIARFEREVQATSELTHPHTIAIYDYGRTPDGLFYYAMEYLDGFDLDALVAADGPQPPGRVAHILRQVCGALAEAHRRGLIHRDVKPANIMLCERGFKPDFVKVLDFGLVRAQERSVSSLSRELLVRGTPLYMAPESIVSPDRVGVGADIYAVGAVAYYLLAGRPPFVGGSPMEVMARQVRERPEPPSAVRPVPAALDALVLACLEKEPDLRPRSMDDLGAVIDALDLKPWTDAAARAWWHERAERVRAAHAHAETPASPPPTVGIDLARRHATGLESTQFARVESG